MTIDTRYLMSPSLQQYFVDKDTGFPLAAGEIYFFEDNNRTMPKSVYEISGSPPDYTFVPLGNLITLSSVGTMADNSGNDIIPYLFPLDEDGNLQLYYIEVYSSGGPTDGILQFTREAWPPEAANESGTQGQDSTLNLIPNGQFRLHNNIGANIPNGIPSGQITTPVTDVAPGGWTFERPSTSLSTDNVSFNRIGAFTDDPTSSPRYEILIQSNGGSPSDVFKDLRKTFGDVNKFASDTQFYTIFFSARSTSGNSFPISFNLIKNFGTGGDAQEVINIEDFMITPVEQNFSISFMWGSNSGNLIGPLDDDFCQLAFSLPVNITFGVAMTDFTNLIGEINIVEFPITTDEDFTDRSLVPPIPGFNAETWGLPIISTATGLDYDYSHVGTFGFTSSLVAPPYSMFAYGATIRTDSFFSDGVPCSRLRNVLLDNSYQNIGIPVWGTGKNYVTAHPLTALTNSAFIVSANNAGVSASIADGAVPTGFTFIRVATGVANSSVYSLNAFQAESYNLFWVQSTIPGGSRPCQSSITSNITVSGNLQTATSAGDNPPFCDVNSGERYGTSTVKFLVHPIVNGLPAAGSYLRIRQPTTVNDVVFWFNVNGAGTQPAVPGTNTYVRINITNYFAANDLSFMLSRAISGAEIGYVLPVSGASIIPNSYFNFFVGSQTYYVWYSLNGLGTDPLITGAIGIKVIYTITDTIDNVSYNTATAINRMYYGLPDTQGWSIKGFSPTGLNDDSLSMRFRINGDGPNQNRLGIYPGSYQYESQLGSLVSASLTTVIGAVDIYPDYPGPSSNPGFTPPSTASTSYAGTSQQDTKNLSLNIFIKY